MRNASSRRSSRDARRGARVATSENALLGHGARPAGGTVEILELRLDPRLEVVLADVGADRLDAVPPLLGRELERDVQRLRLACHIERVDADRPLADLLVG